ncbi:MAG TPA: phosphate/phosphite/phosphonate ABC transporter substrate-binding protein [Fimbriimonadaceae bacterium]|nr:phosphate/phosphite/phosphonate ABC transporter substrate-binding protein [Fimbriimonadaceae bacterium]
MRPIIVGAVVYDPKVVVIWDIIRRFFEERGCPIDAVYYTNYELQNDALLGGHVDVAWNSPLAWLDAQHRAGGRCRAIAMRDTDRDRVTHLLVRADSGIASFEDLRGKTIAFGAKDSPQATLIPVGMLARHGLEAERDYTMVRHDILVGKHGDHVGGELEALRSLQAGTADASFALDLNWANWSTDGTADADKIRILATTDRFDHCVFTVRDEFPADRQAAFLSTLFEMSYDNPDHKEMMDMEGLKRWEEGRTSGFAALSEAIDRTSYWSA